MSATPSSYICYRLQYIMVHNIQRVKHRRTWTDIGLSKICVQIVETMASHTACNVSELCLPNVDPTSVKRFVPNTRKNTLTCAKLPVEISQKRNIGPTSTRDFRKEGDLHMLIVYKVSMHCR